jgi:hypothetical protein
MPAEEKKASPMNVTAWIAIILWVISTVFQFGAIYATNQNKEYVDKKTESLRLEWKDDLKGISDKLDKILLNKKP